MRFVEIGLSGGSGGKGGCTAPINGDPPGENTRRQGFRR
jgi:hypothetical protein